MQCTDLSWWQFQAVSVGGSCLLKKDEGEDNAQWSPAPLYLSLGFYQLCSGFDLKIAQLGVITAEVCAANGSGLRAYLSQFHFHVHCRRIKRWWFRFLHVEFWCRRIGCWVMPSGRSTEWCYKAAQLPMHLSIHAIVCTWMSHLELDLARGGAWHDIHGGGAYIASMGVAWHPWNGSWIRAWHPLGRASHSQCHTAWRHCFLFGVFTLICALMSDISWKACQLKHWIWLPISQHRKSMLIQIWSSNRFQCLRDEFQLGRLQTDSIVVEHELF